VRVALPQSDGLHKPRPAVLIASFPPYGDWLVAGISSSIGLAVPELDIVLDQAHPSFTSARLGFPGIIRLGHAHVVPIQWIEGRIGAVDDDTIQLIRERLAAHILRGA